MRTPALSRGCPHPACPRRPDAPSLVPALCHFLPCLLVLSPGSSLSSGMPFSASHSNQGKHNRNLPWSFPHLPCSLHPHESNVGNPKTSPPHPSGSSTISLGGVFFIPSSLSPSLGPPLVFHTRTSVDFVAQMREETAGPTVICGFCLLGSLPLCPSVLMATRGRGQGSSQVPGT